MAARYVYSGATGTADGSSWTNAYTSINTAYAASSVGDTIYVAHDHAESQGSALLWTGGATSSSNPVQFICVNRAGSVPPVAADLRTTASITTTGTFSLTINISGYFYGLNFYAGSGSTGTVNIAFGGSSSLYQQFDNSTFNISSTGSGSRIQCPNQAAMMVRFRNCSVSFSSTGQGISVVGNLDWTNDASVAPVTGATIPTNLFNGANLVWNEVRLEGLDLSMFGASSNIVANTMTMKHRLINCKLASDTVIFGPNAEIELIGCNNSSNVARNERYRQEAVLTTETTVKRTAGASDGTTPYSWKIVSTSQANRYTLPFKTFDGALWNSTTGSSRTLTAHCVTDNVTLTNADIWLEVEYLGSSATPVATLVSSAPATVLTTSSNLTSDSGEAWTTTGLTTPSKQKFSVSFTPQMAGPIRWRVKVAKASTTVYVDPNPDLT